MQVGIGVSIASCNFECQAPQEMIFAYVYLNFTAFGYMGYLVTASHNSN